MDEGSSSEGGSEGWEEMVRCNDVYRSCSALRLSRDFLILSCSLDSSHMHTNTHTILPIFCFSVAFLLMPAHVRDVSQHSNSFDSTNKLAPPLNIAVCRVVQVWGQDKELDDLAKAKLEAQQLPQLLQHVNCKRWLEAGLLVVKAPVLEEDDDNM